MSDPRKCVFDVIESKVIGKWPDQASCEDALFLGESYIAVIDGATSKSTHRLDGQSGGRCVADALVQQLACLSPGLDGVELVVALTAAVKARIKDTPLWDDRPNAAIAVFTCATGRITRVGDIGVMIGDMRHRAEKSIDAIASQARAAFAHALLMAGERTIAEIGATDPGRAFILPLLIRQKALQNDPSSRFGFGTIDGRDVPERFIEVFEVPVGGDVVMCSDGYPTLEAVLKDAEAVLAQSLTDDPLRIGTWPGTKGFDPESQRSFDDRAYVRVRLTNAS